MTAHSEDSLQPLTLAVIIEWDNIRLSEMERCQMMLSRLSDQLRLLGNASQDDYLKRFNKTEVLIVFDSNDIEESSVRNTINGQTFYSTNKLEVRYLGAPGLTYYELKNYGAKYTEADLILFLDTDVIPEEDWLRQMLLPFSDPKVEVVAGNPYIELHGAYSQAFALTWFFPLRSREKSIRPFYKFWANNVAFRKETFRRFSFPELDGYYRGSCIQLAEILKKNGITIYMNTAAQVSHPPPNGFRHFIAKGIAQGRNELNNRKILSLEKPNFWGSLNQLGQNLKKSFRSVLRNRSEANVSMLGLPLVMTISATYCGLLFLGEVITQMDPQFLSKRLKI